MERTEASSIQKSLSETPSSEFCIGPKNPKSLAVISLFVLYVVPAKAQEPKGQ